jgi:hypothetical protein
MNDGPWMYDNCNLVLERINPGMVPKDVELNHLDMWVQVHNLPFGFMQRRVGDAIGAYLGELKEYDEKNTPHSEFKKLKVRIDITKPLKQEWKVRAGRGDWVSVVFKYERLGTFCYACGLLGYNDRSCEQLFENDMDDGVRGWGDYLKTTSRKLGTGANNKWLRDPVKSETGQAPPVAALPKAANSDEASGSNAAKSSKKAMLNGRMTAVRSEITTLKNRLKAADPAGWKAFEDRGKAALKEGNDMNLLEAHPVVVGLAAHTDEVLALEYVDSAGIVDTDTGSDLKKRKRVQTGASPIDAVIAPMQVSTETGVGGVGISAVSGGKLVV